MRARQHPSPLPAFVLVVFTACNESFLPSHKPAEAREAAPNIYPFGVWQVILMPSDPPTVKRGFLLLWSGQIASVTPAAGRFPGFLGASKQFHNILHEHHTGRLHVLLFVFLVEHRRQFCPKFSVLPLLLRWSRREKYCRWFGVSITLISRWENICGFSQ